MTFRFGALLCLSGLAACANHPSDNVNDASDVNQPNVASAQPAMRPASFEDRKTDPSLSSTTPVTPAPAANAAADQNSRAPLVADTKGTSSADFKGNSASTNPAPATGSTSNGSRTTASDSTNAASQPDNTRVNKRDTNDSALTPMDQSNAQSDLKITQQIRQALMADSSLSFTAKNVKIITQKGKVTLRGPVKTAEERSAIEAAARKVAGAAEIDNQIEVKK